MKRTQPNRIENLQLTVLGQCGTAGKSFDLRKTFSPQLSTKFGVKLPDPGLVPSFLMVTMTTQNSFVAKAVLFEAPAKRTLAIRVFEVLVSEHPMLEILGVLVVDEVL